MDVLEEFKEPALMRGLDADAIILNPEMKVATVRCMTTRTKAIPALTVSLVLLVSAVVRSAMPVDMYPVTEADKKFLIEIVDALQKNDSAWIAGHMVYPLSVDARNRTRTVNSKKEFVHILKRELTDTIRGKIAAAAREAPFKNWQGVMIGDGILWFSQFKHDGDKSWTYGIFAIGGFAFQPKDIQIGA